MLKAHILHGLKKGMRDGLQERRDARNGPAEPGFGRSGAVHETILVQVTDIQASCRKARELGGTIPPGFPFDLPDGIGAIVLVVDPAGHPIGLYSRTPLAPVPAPVK